MLRLTFVATLFLGITALTRFQSLNRLSEQEEEERQQKCGIGNGKKVFNGDHVTNFTFVPYVVAWNPKNAYNEWICSGTLISKRHILTAGHCAPLSKQNCRWRDIKEDFEGMHIALRTICTDPHSTNKFCSPKHENGALIVKAKKMILPSPYVSEVCKIGKNDIMIIELENDIGDDEVDIEYACISTEPARKDLTVRISGYGNDNNHTKGEPSRAVLKTYTTNITDCPTNHYITEDNICAVNNNYQLACAGDSGSGVISQSQDGRDDVRGILVGGLDCWYMIQREGRLRKQPPKEILTDTYKFLDWICFVSGICPREQDRQMVSKYMNNHRAPHPKFVLLEQR